MAGGWTAGTVPPLFGGGLVRRNRFPVEYHFVVFAVLRFFETRNVNDAALAEADALELQECAVEFPLSL